jgi:hypothetical protein
MIHERIGPEITVFQGRGAGHVHELRAIWPASRLCKSPITAHRLALGLRFVFTEYTQR